MTTPLDDDSVWKPLEGAEHDETKTRIVATLVVESFVVANRYHPDSGQLETLTEAEKIRLRIGDYRVFFRPDGSVSRILAVKNRKESYR